MVPSAADQANLQMVDRLIAEGALWTPALIASFRSTPRHRFLDRVFQFHRRKQRWREILTRDPDAGRLRLLYSDRALITHLSGRGTWSQPVPTSSSSQPSLMAQMLEDLQLRPGLRTLEIGAGTGYNAALLAGVVGAGMVVSVDVDRDVLSEAWDHLRAYPERGVELHHADGRCGFPDRAPYDRIMVTAATGDLEPPWLEQLAPEGLVQAPLALAPGLAFIVQGTVVSGVFEGRLTRAAYFMPLRAEDETGSAEIDSLPPVGEYRSRPAPWARWFERRRPRIDWLGFSQALAFYGMLRGLTVHFRALDRAHSGFGIGEPQIGALCWFGPQEWYLIGEKAEELGDSLLRAFLDAGGPWPTEFRLHASPGGGLEAAGPECYVRQGPRCQQLWQLNKSRIRAAWL